NLWSHRQLLELRGETIMIISIDIGGTNIRFSLVDVYTNSIYFFEFWLRDPGSHLKKEVFINKLKEYVKKVEQKENNIYAIAIAVASPVDFKGKKVLTAENIGWENESISEFVQEETGYPTIIETDIVCGAIGE